EGEVLCGYGRTNRTQRQVQCDQPGRLWQRRACRVGQETCLDPGEIEAGHRQRLAHTSIAEWHVMIEEVPIRSWYQAHIRAEQDQRPVRLQNAQGLLQDVQHCLLAGE